MGWSTAIWGLHRAEMRKYWLADGQGILHGCPQKYMHYSLPTNFWAVCCFNLISLSFLADEPSDRFVCLYVHGNSDHSCRVVIYAFGGQVIKQQLDVSQDFKQKDQIQSNLWAPFNVLSILFLSLSLSPHVWWLPRAAPRNPENDVSLKPQKRNAAFGNGKIQGPVEHGPLHEQPHQQFQQIDVDL